MPRKNRDHAAQVLGILHQRGVLDGWEVVAIDGVSHDEALAAILRSRVFLSFGYPEGCGIPPIEALAAACVVIGYHGEGGREYLTEETAYPVPFGAILEFARTVERVLGEIGAGHPEPDGRAAAGRRLVARTYTDEAFRTSTDAAWSALTRAAGADLVRLDATVPEHALALRPVHDPRDAELERLAAEADAARRARDVATAERDAARARTDDLLRSTSWRVTRPLRAARNALRRDDPPR